MTNPAVAAMLSGLSEPFPRDAVSWRAQTVNRDGNKAMALAYIDARDVMRRLDEVAGAENWQDRYEVHGAKTLCYLSIRIDGEWVTKADGAGDTDVEAEKGSISDAFKRAAVKWGVGRYLYDMPSPWVPCDSYEKNGKKYWSKWTADPWSYVKHNSAPAGLHGGAQKQAVDGNGSPSAPVPPAPLPESARTALVTCRGAVTRAELRSIWRKIMPSMKSMLDEGEFARLKGDVEAIAKTLPENDQTEKDAA